MAPKYKVHYFNFTAMGEPLRFLCAYGNLDWEDIRYDDDQWAKSKSKMPFRQIPALEIDGKMYAQSGPICRYLARQVGLAGKNDIENLEIDMMVDLFHDFKLDISRWYTDPVPENKALKETRLFNEQIPFYMNKFESMVKKNGGYLVNSRLTWADIFFVAPLKSLKFLLGKDFLEGYPDLQELIRKVESEPNIAAYIARRPPGNR